MTPSLNPYFNIKPGIHEACHAAFGQAKPEEQQAMAMASELAVFCQQERAGRHAARVRGEDVEAASMQAGFEAYRASHGLTEDALFVAWPSLKPFLKRYWAHEQKCLPALERCLDAFVEKEKYQGKSSHPSAGGLKKFAYDMAKDWAKRMQICARAGVPVSECAELTFRQAFDRAELDSIQMVRAMAAQYLQFDWTPDESIKEAFDEWFETHREPPVIPGYDRDCPHTGGGLDWRGAILTREVKSSPAAAR